MMRTADRGFALLYFESKMVRSHITGLAPNARYQWSWFDPRKGAWRPAQPLATDASGTAMSPVFPDGAAVAALDWAAKLELAR